MNRSTQQQLEEAVAERNTGEVLRILKEKEKEVIVNQIIQFTQTLLSFACHNNYFEIASGLLAHPDIQVNAYSNHFIGHTAFVQACVKDSMECVRLLLLDPRTDVDIIVSESNILYWCATGGHLEVIKEWIASGRNLGLGGPPMATQLGRTIDQLINLRPELATVSLLGKYFNDREGVMHQMRLEKGWYDRMASEIFALVVFLSDCLLQIGPLVFSRSTSTARFFEIAKKLPQELQMVLCYRVVGSRRTLIPSEKREEGFRGLAKKYSYE
jgi:hypothetical protein